MTQSQYGSTVLKRRRLIVKQEWWDPSMRKNVPPLGVSVLIDVVQPLATPLMHSSHWLQKLLSAPFRQLLLLVEF
jgi:hypothetical protein